MSFFFLFFAPPQNAPVLFLKFFSSINIIKIKNKLNNFNYYCKWVLLFIIYLVFFDILCDEFIKRIKNIIQVDKIYKMNVLRVVVSSRLDTSYSYKYQVAPEDCVPHLYHYSSLKPSQIRVTFYIPF